MFLLFVLANDVLCMCTFFDFYIFDLVYYLIPKIQLWKNSINGEVEEEEEEEEEKKKEERKKEERIKSNFRV